MAPMGATKKSQSVYVHLSANAAAIPKAVMPMRLKKSATLSPIDF